MLSNSKTHNNMLTQQEFAAYAAAENADATKHVAENNDAIIAALQKRTTRTGRTLPLGSIVEFTSDLLDHLDLYLKEEPMLDSNGNAMRNNNGEPIKVLHVACAYNGVQTFLQLAKFVAVCKCLNSDAFANELTANARKYGTQTKVLQALTVYDQLAALQGSKIKATFMFKGKVHDFAKNAEVERSFTLYTDIE